MSAKRPTNGQLLCRQIGAFWREVEVGCTTWPERMSANGKISSENNLRYIVKDFLFRFNNYDVIPLINLIIMMSLLPLCYTGMNF
jgi:hypothetical protein